MYSIKEYVCVVYVCTSLFTRIHVLLFRFYVVLDVLLLRLPHHAACLFSVAYYTAADALTHMVGCRQKVYTHTRIHILQTSLRPHSGWCVKRLATQSAAHIWCRTRTFTVGDQNARIHVHIPHRLAAVEPVRGGGSLALVVWNCVCVGLLIF